MTARRLIAELEAGGIEVELALQRESGNPVLERLAARISAILEQQVPGSGFEGTIRQAEGESSALVRFGEGWQSVDARQILNHLLQFHAMLSDDALPGPDVPKEDDLASESPEAVSSEKAESRLQDRELSAVDRSGWIREIAENASRPASLLREHGVDSDEQYLQVEESLSPEQRLELAKSRYRYGMRQSESQDAPGGIDLQILASFVPPWISHVPIGLKGFPNRGRNCFRDVGIKTMEDLARMPLEKMLRIEAFGKTTYEQIAEAFAREMIQYASAKLADSVSAASDGAAPEKPSGADFSSFDGLWSEVLKLVDNESAREILTRRTGAGLPHGKETLEEVGNSRGVTRERIRQIEKRAIERLRDNPEFKNLRSNLESEIESRIRWSGAPLMLGNECPLPALRGASFRTVKQFFQLILGSNYKVLISHDEEGNEVARIVYGMSEAELSSVLGALRQFIMEHRHQSRSIFIPEVERYIASNHHESIHSDLKAFVDDWINWDYSRDQKIISFGDSIEAVTAAVLERASRPLKLDELIRIARNDFALDQTEASIRNAVGILCQSPGNRTRQDVAVSVFQTAPSEFTTERNLPIDLEQSEYLVPTLRKLIVEGRECLIPGEPYQWHTLDLWKELNREIPGNELCEMDSSVGWRAVDWLLRYHAPPGVVNLMKGRWVRELSGRCQEARTFEQGLVLVLEQYFQEQRGSRKEVLEKLEMLQSIGHPRVMTTLKSPLNVDAKEIWLTPK